MWILSGFLIFLIWLVSLYFGNDLAPVLGALFFAYVGLSAKISDIHRRRVEENVAAAETIFKLAKAHSIDLTDLSDAADREKKEEPS